MPNEVELVYSARVYVSAISRIHEKVRKLIKEKLNQSRNTIDQVIIDFKAKNDDNALCLRASAQEIVPPHDVKENVPIFLDWDDVRIELMKRNRNLGNLEKIYVRGRSGL